MPLESGSLEDKGPSESCHPACEGSGIRKKECPLKSWTRESQDGEMADDPTDEDGDFVPGSRVRGGRKQKSSSVSADSGDPLKDCPICLFTWNSTGPHRVCCLKCGHLFGKSCIEKWVRQQKSCPQCNQKAVKSDIRVLFTAKFAVADVSLRDEVEKKLRKEKAEKIRFERERNSMERKIIYLEDRIRVLERIT